MISPITHRSTFAALAADGTRARSGPVRVTHLPDAPRCAPDRMYVGFVFGRRFGSAVERNRARRRLRAAIRHQLNLQQCHGAFLFAGSRGVLSAPFEQLEAHVRRCLHEAVAA